ncbi:sugar ABC transporter permease, partial [Neobacillus niacini]
MKSTVVQNLSTEPNITLKKESRFRQALGRLNKYKALYFISLPGILYFLVFKYTPLLGSIIAFKDYNIFIGIWDSTWVGLKHFKALFENPDSIRVLKNTL